MEEYEAIPEKGHGKTGKTKFVNEVDYKKHEANVLGYEVKKDEIVAVRLQWLTNLKMTEENAYDLVCSRRKR